LIPVAGVVRGIPVWTVAGVRVETDTQEVPLS
jgi:hypothetical protein